MRHHLIILLTTLLVGSACAGLHEDIAPAQIEVLVNGRHSGSGWFADTNGLVVTAGHVVYGVTNGIEVMSPTIGRVKAEVVAVDRGHDLALLRTPKRARPYSAMQIADAVPEEITEIYLFGAPLFRHEVLVTGKVACSTPSYEFIPSLRCYGRVYYVGGASPKGMSGGCWVNTRQQVVGNQSGFIGKEVSVGIAYVAPPSAIRDLVRTQQAPATADMGAVIEELWEKPAEFIKKFPAGVEGVLIVKLYDEGPAKTAGLTKDTLIVALDGQPIRLRDQFFNYVRSKKPGDSVAVRVIAPGEKDSREVRMRLNRL